MIGFDCGSEPSKKFDSFEVYVDETIRAFENPEPLPSSFDDSCPLLNRFQIMLWIDYGGGTGCWIQPQEGDRPLTADRLRAHAIDVADVERCVQSIVAAIANVSPESIELSDQPPPPHYGEFVVGFQKPKFGDNRLDSASLNIHRGYVSLDLGSGGAPFPGIVPAAEIKVAWEQFEEGVVRLLEVLHPPGTRVRIKEQPLDEITVSLAEVLFPLGTRVSINDLQHFRGGQPIDGAKAVRFEWDYTLS
jgi:hypothetical protein